MTSYYPSEGNQGAKEGENPSHVLQLGFLKRPRVAGLKQEVKI